jgi:hypothetical protein
MWESRCAFATSEEAPKEGETMSKDLQTIRLSDGKYEFDLFKGRIIAARRHGVDWPAGFEWRHSHAVVAMLQRIAELDPSEETTGNGGSDGNQK